MAKIFNFEVHFKFGVGVSILVILTEVAQLDYIYKF